MTVRHGLSFGMSDPQTTRRRALTGIAAGTIAGLAGCLGGGDDDGDDTNDSTGTDDGTDDNGASSEAAVRVAHLSPDAPNVDVYVDSEDPTLADVAFGDVSNYLDVPAGDRAVEITAAGDPDTSVFSGDVSVESETEYTIAAIGELSDDGDEPFEPLVLEDNNSSVDSDTARLRVVHASPDAPAVDVTAAGGEVVLFDGVGYAESGYTEVEANDYTVEIRGDTESNDGDIAADFDVSLDGGTVYTAFAVGYLTPNDAPADTAFDLLIAQDSSA